MREVFSAVIVIGLVLVAVFVPVAFFPGTTGRLYQQFSLTIAFSVVLSVFNAVTFTPALSALLLDQRRARATGRFFTWRQPGHRRRHELLRADACGGRSRSSSCMLLLFVGGLWATWAVYRAVPSSFVPDEDEGYFIAIIQAPAGSSLEYTIEHREAGRADHHEAAGSAGRVFGRRLQLQRIGAESGADVRAVEGVRGAEARGASRCRAARPTRLGGR